MKNTHFRVAARPALVGLAALAVLLSVAAPDGSAQLAPTKGIRHIDPRWDALVGATVVAQPGQTIDNATIVFRDGVIVSVKAGATPPAGARVWDYTGKTIYPGLIEPHLPVSAPQPDEKAPGNHWNKKVTPQRSALDGEGGSKGSREKLRKMGFTAAAIAPKGGVFRGSAAVVLLDDTNNDSAADHELTVVRDRAYQEIAFESGGFGRPGGYPGSQMGAIALVRQTFSDADWRAKTLAVYANDPSKTEPPAPADALDALGPQTNGDLFLFNAGDELQILRSAKVAREFGRNLIVLGSGTEFRRLDAIVADDLPLIVPLAFPKKPEVASIADQNAVSLRDLMTWEQAPTNLRRLINAGATVALTTDKLPKGQKFMDNLRSAIDTGLTKDDALAMLTTTPAKLLSVDDRLGRIAPGYLANVVVVDGDLFDKKGVIDDVWIDGRRNEIKAPPSIDIKGEWAAVFTEGDKTHAGELTIKKGNKLSFNFDDDHKNIKARNVKLVDNRLSFLLDGKDFDLSGVFAVSGAVRGESITGIWNTPEGNAFTWRADRTSAGETANTEADDAKKDDDKDADDATAGAIPEALPIPFGAYGFMKSPPQEDVIITGATIWTAGPEGIINNGTLVISGGKIVEVSSRHFDNVMGMRVIDAKGKHITPGLIDAHSHTGISGGVNEGTHAVTSEVRIQDVINPDAIGLWRELAGGLTVANQLHGSANPIGGQTSVVKLRWGVGDPNEMRFEGATPGIKFALGENVKQSNWGEKFRTRYPQTRMGVDTIIRDRFNAAREYAKDWDRYNNLTSSEKRFVMPPRRDLRLEALVEILNGDRLVHSHSYRQDEILMLGRIAQDFGFKIGTFQHVLEGYKVAEAIKETTLGGASTFSDWWAYKFEVYDANPYNGAIMTKAGVRVSYNSDSDEQARRLNTEAGKAVKYGDLAPEEAIKFVTYNPAVQLGIADRVGSLAAGKDADFVIWSGDPLSYFSRAEATFVDGREIFSLEKNKELRKRDQAERQRIIQKILAKKGGKKKDDKDKETAQAKTASAHADKPSESTASQ